MWVLGCWGAGVLGCWMQGLFASCAGYLMHQVPFSTVPTSEVCSQAHADLALSAAQQGTVLLKNSGALPLSAATIKSLAVIGPNGEPPTCTRTCLSHAPPPLPHFPSTKSRAPHAHRSCAHCVCFDTDALYA
jgi:hypothetical protein